MRCGLHNVAATLRMIGVVAQLVLTPVYAADKSGVSPQTLSLPSGPGSIEGLGESFQPQLNSGTFNYAVPLAFPKCRGDVMPAVSLTYGSGNGNGPVGIGWALGIPRVQRQTDKGLPLYNDSDRFIDSNSEELVATADGYHRAKNESSFIRYQRTNGWWKVTLPDGTVYALGQTLQARLERSPGETFAWLLESAQDLNGNRVEYKYFKDRNQIYLDEVTYGLHISQSSGTFRIKCSYETNRPDCFIDYRGRFRSQTALRLSDISGYQGNRRLRSWRLGYAPGSRLSLLATVTVFGDDRSNVGSGTQANRDYLPPLQLGYTSNALGQTARLVACTNVPSVSFVDGIADLVDINRDGLPDILWNDQGVYLSILNQGESRPWASPREITNSPTASFASPTTRLADLRGDGKSKLLLTDDQQSFYFRDFSSPVGLGPAVDFLIPGSFPLSDPDVQFADINNDRAIDLVATDGTRFDFLINRQAVNGTNYVLSNPPPPPASGIRFSDGWQLVDLNGDRLPDLVLIGAEDEGGTFYHLGKGWGEFDTREVIRGGPATLGVRGREAYHIADVDQDGLADLVMIDSGVVRFWLGTCSNRWSSPITLTTNIPDFDASTTAIRFADMNGNGSVDIVWNRADQGSGHILQYLDLLPGIKPYQLNRIQNGIGRDVHIEYRSSTDYMIEAAMSGNPWTSTIPFPVPVVSAYTVLDSLGGSYRTEITYRNAYYDGAEKEFRGFEYAESKDVGDDSQGAPSLVSASGFDVGRNTESLKGKLLFSETRTESGSAFSRETNSWAARVLPIAAATGETRQVTFAFMASNVTHVIEGLASTQALVLEEEFQFDDFGNPTRHADYGIVQNGNRSAFNDERITTTEYALNTNAWILRNPKRTEVKDENGLVVSRAEFYYDDETFSGNNMGVVTVGNLTLKREWIDPANPAAFIKSARTKYDAYGNPTTLLDPLAQAAGGGVDLTKGHVREIAYDPLIHTYPVTETIHTGNGQAPLIFQANYDLGLGTVTNSLDFNTNATSYTYDAFARLTNIVRPGDSLSFPTVEYDYALGVPVGSTGLVNYVETRQLDKAPGTVGAKRNHYFISRQFVDGLGRKLMTKTEAEAAEGSSTPRVVVNGAVQFNARQKPLRVLNPFFSLQGSSLDELLAFENIEAAGWQGQFQNEGSLLSLNLAAAHATRTDYDATLRAKKVTNPDGTFRTTVYEPLLTRSFDENQSDPSSPYYGNSMIHYNDGLGRLIRVDEVSHLADDGTPAGELRVWTTRYEHDLNDQLTRITDSQNNVKTFAYDGLKRKTDMNDPDRGVMHFVYDDASNLTETTDAKAQRITYTYDGANRIFTEKYHDGAPLPTWRGAPLPEGEGAGVRGNASLSNSVVYHYDQPYPNLDLGDTTTGAARNTRGTLAWVEDLSGEEHTSYDSRGRAEWVTNRLPDPEFLHAGVATTLVSYRTLFGYDSLDRMTNLVYPDLDQHPYVYNDRNLVQRIPGGPSGSIISNIIYVPSAQIGQIDYGNTVRTTYEYDSRLRLKNLHTFRPLSASGGEGQGEVELINFAYDFDGVSNIKQISDKRPASAVSDGDPRRNTQLFQYDDLYRLKRAQYSFALPGVTPRNDGEINYRYDRIGNMLSQLSTINQVEKGLPVANLGAMDSGGAAGRFNRVGRGPTDPPGPHALSAIRNSQLATRNYPYDPNGNMTNIDGLACTWDFKDRLVVVENTEMRATYTYDYTDRRVLKSVTYKPGTSNYVNHDSRITTLYINKYFEVREHDAPTKYVWNGNTRIAHVTGSLNTNLRVQRLRLWPGWNLCSLAVSSASPLWGEGRGEVLSAAFRWNSASQDWQAVAAGETFPAGTVLWLKANTNGSLTLTGAYSDPTNRTVTTDGDFLPSAGLEAWNVLSTLNSQPSTVVWAYDAQTAKWLSWLPPPLQLRSDLAAFIGPGEAVFVDADTVAQLRVAEKALRILYYHQDHLCSSARLTDGERLARDEQEFFPFGHSRIASNGDERSSGYTFTQKENDAEDGLSYFESRYLSTPLGRFIGLDPLSSLANIKRFSEPSKLNGYAYGLNRPIIFIDPSGLDATAWSVAGSFGHGLWNSTIGAVISVVQGARALATDPESQRLLAYGLTHPAEIGDALGLVGKHAVAETGRVVVRGSPDERAQLLGSVAGLFVPTGLAKVGSLARVSLAMEGGGVLAEANFAQRTFSQVFSSDGLFAGRTVQDVAAALRSGQMSTADIPIQYIIRDSNTLILNTRSAQALEQAGIPRAQWKAVNMTGDAAAEARLTAQLQRNQLTSEGISIVTQKQR